MSFVPDHSQSADWNFDQIAIALGSGSQSFQPGDLKIAAYTTPDPGWLLCDGSAVSRTTYARLFARIGTTYGVGNGTTTFNVPTTPGRTPIGSGTATGAHGATNHTLGATGGEETHQLTTAELASHVHPPGLGTSYLVGGAGGGVGTAAGATVNSTANTGSAGSDGSHNTMQPFFTVNFFIKA